MIFGVTLGDTLGSILGDTLGSMLGVVLGSMLGEMLGCSEIVGSELREGITVGNTVGIKLGV